ncbi:hypothetical protein HHI36_020957 [Cryptolaemus montrouzieri]|uniref:C2H2-type domain-containing protein n=1 Tax=Cryptolaemus montrouzieri TaxID=559131 RepID=A0ABD2NC33_9CUCU
METLVKIEPMESTPWEQSNQNSFEEIMKTIKVDTNVWDDDERTEDSFCLEEDVPFDTFFSNIELVNPDEHIEDNVDYLVDHFVDGNGKTWVMKGEGFVENGVTSIMNEKSISDSSLVCNLCGYYANCKANLRDHDDSFHSKGGDKDTKSIQCSLLQRNDVGPEISLRYSIDGVPLKFVDFKCSLCSFQCASKSTVAQHMDNMHFKTETFECHFCDFETDQQKKLKHHIKTKHSAVQFKNHSVKMETYKCYLCSINFKGKEELNRHVVRKHQDIVSYNCDLCLFNTNNRKQFNQHSITAHKKKYLCNWCGFKTLSLIMFEKHVDAHKKIEFVSVKTEEVLENEREQSETRKTYSEIKNKLKNDFKVMLTNNCEDMIDLNCSALEDHTYSIKYLGNSVYLVDHTYSLKSSWRNLLVDNVTKIHQCYLCDHTYSNGSCISKENFEESA